MSKSLSKSRLLFSLIFTAIAFFMISCSQVTPEIAMTDYSIIFDYEDEESAPAARLSVFAASSSDVRRYSRIKITSLDTGFTWETDNIARMENEEVQWAGCTNLVAPDDEKLPVGKYEITYYNADEKECTVKLEVRYDIGFYDVLLNDLADYMADKHGIEKIAVYDKEHILIYFGVRTENFKTTRDIWNTYREAEYYQVIWYSRDGKVICVEPEKLVVPETEKKEEEIENTEESVSSEDIVTEEDSLNKEE